MVSLLKNERPGRKCDRAVKATPKRYAIRKTKEFTLAERHDTLLPNRRAVTDCQWIVPFRELVRCWPVKSGSGREAYAYMATCANQQKTQHMSPNLLSMKFNRYERHI